MRTMNRLTRCSLAALLTLFAFSLVFAASTAYAQPDAGVEAPVADGEGEGPADSPDAVPGEDAVPGGDAVPGDLPTGDADPSAQSGTVPNANDVPVNLRLRRLEQRVQALKERAWRAKARVGMLKEAVLGGGVGARAGIKHINKMGNSYRLVKLVYALDGAQIFARNDPSGALHDDKSFDVLTGPISPGSHTISVLALYRGHGYGVFKYLKKYKFTVRSSHTFTATEGKGTDIKVVAFERGGVTTPLEKRPAFDFKVNVSDGSKGK